MKETVVLALATMAGVGYLVFKAGGSGFAAHSGGSSGSLSAPSGGSVGGGSAQRSTLTFAPSSAVKANPIVENSGLSASFIKSVETPLPKQFEPAIYMHQIEALRARGY